VSAEHALKHALDAEEVFADLPAREYFDVDPTVDVVVFGHSHLAGYRRFPGYGRPKVFANSGCWVDANAGDPDNTCTFVLVESTLEGDAVQTLKCTGDGRVDDIVWADNAHIQRA
jgi:predicted phosphodiesterase